MRFRGCSSSRVEWRRPRSDQLIELRSALLSMLDPSECENGTRTTVGWDFSGSGLPVRFSSVSQSVQFSWFRGLRPRDAITRELVVAWRVEKATE